MDADVLNIVGLTLAEHNEEVKKQRRLYRWMSNLGPLVIFFGFGYQ